MQAISDFLVLLEIPTSRRMLFSPDFRVAPGENAGRIPNSTH
jgi:hypothetical protein